MVVTDGLWGILELRSRAQIDSRENHHFHAAFSRQFEIWSKLDLKACCYYNSLWPSAHALLGCSLSGGIVVDPHHTVFKASCCQNLFTVHQGSNMICFLAFVREINSVGSSASPEMRSSLQESGKRHGIICNIVLSIRFHSRSWVALGCRMIFRWSSAN